MKKGPNNKMYYVMLVSCKWNGARSLKERGRAETKEAAKKIWRKCIEASDAEYRVLGPIQLKKLQAEIKAEQAERRKKGQARAAAKRKKDGIKPVFVLCPHCRAKSKLLGSEMGGLQTRRCKNGHYFEYDKWIADRAWGALVFNGKFVDPYTR